MSDSLARVSNKGEQIEAAPEWLRHFMSTASVAGAFVYPLLQRKGT